MTLGNASWGFRETPLEKQLEITASMGLGLLELGIANPPGDLPLSASDAEIDAVRALYDKYGVALSCAATGNDFTKGNRDDLDKVKKVVGICEKLGVRYLRIFAGFSPVGEVVGERWDTMISCLKEIKDYAKARGVAAVVETHGGVIGHEDGVEHFMSTSAQPETLLKMLEEVPGLMLNYDPANLYAVGIERPETVYEKIRDRVSCIHLKDFVKLPSGHFKPGACGESDMDWRAILKALKGFDGPALFEYENTGDIEDGCRRSLAFIRSLLEEESHEF